MAESTTVKKSGRAGRLAVLAGMVVLFVAHQDQWFWDDSRMAFGFMPTGLTYHAIYSLAAAALWWAAAKWAWPAELETFAGGGDETEAAGSSEAAP